MNNRPPIYDADQMLAELRDRHREAERRRFTMRVGIFLVVLVVLAIIIAVNVS